MLLSYLRGLTFIYMSPTLKASPRSTLHHQCSQTTCKTVQVNSYVHTVLLSSFFWPSAGEANVQPHNHQVSYWHVVADTGKATSTLTVLYGSDMIFFSLTSNYSARPAEYYVHSYFGIIYSVKLKNPSHQNSLQWKHLEWKLNSRDTISTFQDSLELYQQVQCKDNG